MIGDIVVIGKSILVSNIASLEVQTDIIDTPTGKVSEKTKVFDVSDPFGKLERFEDVEVAFKSNDGDRLSYRGQVTSCTQYRCIIKIKELTEDYKNIIRRAKAWQV